MTTTPTPRSAPRSSGPGSTWASTASSPTSRRPRTRWTRPHTRPSRSLGSHGPTCAPTTRAPSPASSCAARHPGLRRDYERWLRQPLPAELAQGRAPIGLEAGDVRPRRGDAERERLPPLLERGVLDVHRDGAVDDVADSSRAKEV